MKFIDSRDKKREVVKTLAGLADFYVQNASVGCLLMVVFYKIKDVDIDAQKWEADFTKLNISPSVITMLVPVP